MFRIVSKHYVDESVSNERNSSWVAVSTLAKEEKDVIARAADNSNLATHLSALMNNGEALPMKMTGLEIFEYGEADKK